HRPERVAAGGESATGPRCPRPVRRRAPGRGAGVARGRGTRWSVVVAGLVLVAGCTPPAPTEVITGPPPVVECAAVVDTEAPFDPGASGLCDTYYPQAGNGGYDVADYHLDLTYDP